MLGLKMNHVTKKGPVLLGHGKKVYVIWMDEVPRKHVATFGKKLSLFVKKLKLHASNDTLKPGQDGWHFADSIFKCIRSKENGFILI